MSAPTRRWGEAGAASSISVVLMLPVLTLLLFAAVQATLWNHARTRARATARTTAALVARSGAEPADVEEDAEANLASRSDLRDVDVTIAITPSAGSGSTVTVRVVAKAPGIVIGTWSRVTVDVAMPMEAWSTP